MYTSGTTGFPKGVMQGHNVLRNVFDDANRFGVTPNDSILDYLPLYPRLRALHGAAHVAGDRCPPRPDVALRCRAARCA